MDYLSPPKALPHTDIGNNMYETSIENYLVAGVEAKGGKCLKLVDQGRRGFPDRTVLMPGGKIIFVETKTADGHVQSWQNRYHVALRDLGFRVEVLYTCVQADRFLATI
jgi:hypothetical protein